jgi:hypothetical protein
MSTVNLATLQAEMSKAGAVPAPPNGGNISQKIRTATSTPAVKAAVQAKIGPSVEEQLQAELARLKAENEALRNKQQGERKLTVKISEKGALSVYGLGRFPVTLYREQWEFLLANSSGILAYIKANEKSLKVKGQ